MTLFNSTGKDFPVVKTKIQVDYTHVRSHSWDYGNQRADALAKNGADEHFDRDVFDGDDDVSYYTSSENSDSDSSY